MLIFCTPYRTLTISVYRFALALLTIILVIVSTSLWQTRRELSALRSQMHTGYLLRDLPTCNHDLEKYEPTED